VRWPSRKVAQTRLANFPHCGKTFQSLRGSICRPAVSSCARLTHGKPGIQLWEELVMWRST